MIPQIQIEKNCHTRFRVESELKTDAKGGYIRGKISLPHELVGLYGFKLALYDLHDKPHTNLLFVTPFTRQIYGQNASKKDLGISPVSYSVSIIYKNGTYTIDPKNHPYLTSLAQKNQPIVGPQFWNPQKNEFNLGPEGLRLTVLKPLMKGNNSKITDSKMRFQRDISKDYKLDNTKVKLGLMIDFDFKFLDGADRVYFSNVIEDTAEYDLVIADSTTKAICNNGKFLLKIDLKKGRLTKTKISHLDLTLVDEYMENEFLCNIQYKILSQKEIQFYFQTNTYYNFETDLNLQLEVYYKDGTAPKTFKKERYIKITDHIQTSCHCHHHRVSVERFFKDNPKLREQSRFLKRKFPNHEANENFAEYDFAKFIGNDEITSNSMEDLDDIEPSYSTSTVKFIDESEEEEICTIEKCLPICITINVIGKKQSQLQINEDGSTLISEQSEQDMNELVVHHRVKSAKVGRPLDTPRIVEQMGPPSSSNFIGSINAISVRRPPPRPIFALDMRHLPPPDAGNCTKYLAISVQIENCLFKFQKLKIRNPI